MIRQVLCITLLLVLGGTTRADAARQDDSLAITVAELAARLRFLSSDLLEGRAPGTRGEALTIAYLTSELEALGVEPGTSAGWLQPVEIVTHTPDPTPPTLRLSGPASRTIVHGRDVRLFNLGVAPAVASGGELVFVGHGITAPAYGWDDYAQVDVRGRIVVLLAGEPALEGDTVRFNGARASRYGSFDEKLAEAERRGAVGALVVVAGDIPPGAPGGRRRLAADARAARLLFAGQIKDSVLASTLPSGVPPLDSLVAAAQRPGFRAVPLGLWFDARFRTRPGLIRTANVVGKVPGRDSALAAEHVVLSAHWDAYGIGRPVNGDSIYNGALDDGSGMTVLLALARVLAAHPPRRSITLLFTTAEEWGLLGASAFVRDGPIPMARVVANLNVDDGGELWGRTRDVAPLGIELSTLGDAVDSVASRHGLRVSPDPTPAEGFFLRADNFPFALAGVPALYAALGLDFEGRPTGWGRAELDRYLEGHYHRPSDDYATVALDLRGSQQLALFLRDLAVLVADATPRPEWRPGAEFARPSAGSR